MSVHPRVVAFGRIADAYERGRPTFPAAGIAHLTRALDLRPGRSVLDLAAGTGKLTRLLVASGASVVAVEPVEGMRQVFQDLLPRVPVHPGTAEALPLGDHSVDAVTVAQAFHWFDAPAAFAELDRVLRADGRVALVWNVRDESDAMEAAATAILMVHRGDTPGVQTMDLPAVVGASAFRQVDAVELPWSVTVDRDAFLARYLSVSFVADLDRARQDDVSTRLGALFDEHAVDGVVEHHYTFRSHVLARRDR